MPAQHELIDIPKVLYKYRCWENESVLREERFGAAALLNFELFASPKRFFNDPFDNALPYKYTSESFTLKNFVDKYLATYDKRYGYKTREQLIYDATDMYNFIKTHPEKHWQQNSSAIEEKDDKFYGILSLAESPLEMLMWSHYANYHKGYCIGLKGQEFADFLARQYQEFGFKLGPVRYAFEYPEVDFVKDDYRKISFIRAFTKHKCWNYENEYRLVLHNKSKEKIFFPPELISEIYIGCKMDSNHVNQILHFIREKKLSISVYKLQMGYYRFELEKQLIHAGY